jgi:hypothetical protein
MCVVRDEETGGLLVAEAGRHRPFAEPRFRHARLHAEDIPHQRDGPGFNPGSRVTHGFHGHDQTHEQESAVAGAAD